MAGEIVEGRRTLIERDGHEHELRQGHRVSLSVGLSTGSEGSTFAVQGVELRDDDAVVLHLGENRGNHGLGTYGDRSEVRGYQFPEG